MTAERKEEEQLQLSQQPGGEAKAPADAACSEAAERPDDEAAAHRSADATGTTGTSTDEAAAATNDETAAQDDGIGARDEAAAAPDFEEGDAPEEAGEAATGDEEDDDEETGLYEHFAVAADRGQTPIRLDMFLKVRMEHSSRNRIQAAIDSGNVLVNGRPSKSSYKVKPLDRIQVVMPYPRRDRTLVAQPIPLDIPYEDDDLLIVNKPAGMVVHPGVGNHDGTLVNALLYHLGGEGEAAGGESRAGLVHRIDKDTSGLLVIAKNETAHARLAKQFFDHTIHRRYVALVWGDFDADEGTVTGHIGRSPRDRQKMYVYEDGSQGKHAVTHWRVLRRYGYVTLIECRLETGRTHQIRVHLAWQGHPLFNDARYGGDRILKGTTFAKYRKFIENCFALLPRQALHARSLGFVHPTTGREMRFDSELPDDFRAVLARWDTYTAATDTFDDTEEL